MPKKMRLRTGFLIVALGLLALWAGTAAASTEKRAVATISMEDGSTFQGPDSIAPGAQLRILNNSEFQEHFFSIAKADEIPISGSQFRKCNALELKVCMRIAKEHKVGTASGVGKQLVKNGKDGWDKAFSRSADGDSWYSDRAGEKITQTVSAKAGKTLSYFCLIHRGMDGELRVEAPQ